MTRRRTPLALALSLLACAALSAPADAPAVSVVPPRADAASIVPARASRADASRASARRARTQKTSSGCVDAAKPRTRRSAKPRCTTAARRTTTRRTTPKKTRALRSRSSGQALTKLIVEGDEAQAAAIAKVLATPCQNTGLTPEPSNLPVVRAAVLCLVNTVRAQNGRPPLQPNAYLEAAAESHGKEMIAVDYFDHVSPSGITPVDRVRQTGYIPNSEVGYVIGENLAWGTLTLSTPAAIVEAWVHSPEHLANILEANYQDTGIDVEPEVPQSLAEGVQGGLYTQEFGVIVH